MTPKLRFTVPIRESSDRTVASRFDRRPSSSRATWGSVRMNSPAPIATSATPRTISGHTIARKALRVVQSQTPNAPLESPIAPMRTAACFSAVKYSRSSELVISRAEERPGLEVDRERRAAALQENRVLLPGLAQHLAQVGESDLLRRPSAKRDDLVRRADSGLGGGGVREDPPPQDAVQRRTVRELLR